MQSSQLLFWWLFALLGSEGGPRAIGGGQGRGMDVKFKQNNRKSRKLLAFGCLYSSGRQSENLLSRYMLSILRRILRYLRKSSKLVLNLYCIQTTYAQWTLSLLFWDHQIAFCYLGLPEVSPLECLWIKKKTPQKWFCSVY